MGLAGRVGRWTAKKVNDFVCGRHPVEQPWPFYQVLETELDVIDRKRTGAVSTGGDSAILTATGAWQAANPPRPGETTEDPHKIAETRRKEEHRAVKRALDRDLTGLAFSGGGIRSATFNLGIIQALADLRLLPSIDYLSTVSGGGYIGSWLTALIERENRRPERSGRLHGIEAVQDRLRTRRRFDQPVEDDAVSFLRRYSNYLTPRLGLLSADTWSLIATYLRNLVLNLSVLLPSLGLLLLVPWLLSFFAVSLEAWLCAEQGANERCSLFFWLSLGFGALATAEMGYNMASLVGKVDRTKDRRSIKRLQPRRIRWWLAFPLLASAFAASRWMPEMATEEPTCVGAWMLWVAVAYGGSWLLAAVVAKQSEWRAQQTVKLWAWLVGTALVCGAVAGAALFGIGRFLHGMQRGEPLAPAIFVWGPPLILVWFVLLGVIQTGILGRLLEDRQREWMSRLGAWLLIYSLGWTVVMSFTVYGPVLIEALAGWLRIGLAGGWLTATLAGLVAGRTVTSESSAGPGLLRRLVVTAAPYVFIAGLLLLISYGLSAGLATLTDHEQDWRAFRNVRTEWAARRELVAELAEKVEAGDSGSVASHRAFAKSTTLAALTAPLQVAHDRLLVNIARYEEESSEGGGRESSGLDYDLILVSAAVAILALLTWVLAWRIDVNEFSMHSLYRNRLVRAYLGASVSKRRWYAQPFTGFFLGDDLPLAGTDQPETVTGKQALDLSRRGPLHLVNVALNLVAGEELAWQERKAASFVLSPLFSGFEPPDEDDFNAALTPSIQRHGYRPTDQFASHPTRQRLTLGSAFAISGAAASPNMGFRSTPAFAFLLTVLNVRLGFWLGNPRHARTWRRSGPMIALLHLLQEISGSTRGRTRYVYVSDGGHFENLGIYELVRRRCRFIIACDAGDDGDLAFGDLGNAIRKCRSDLGADIELDLDPLRRKADGDSLWHCALGTVHYLREGEEGTILYIKASMTGDEPADVGNYRCDHPSFPHQTTGDQFFDESQFESYRRLGHHIATEILSDAAVRATAPPGRVAEPGFRWHRPQLACLWRGLAERWLSPSKGARDGFTRLTQTLVTLLDRQRRDDRLRFLDAQFYPEWHRLLEGTDEPAPADTLWLPASAAERAQGFYFCNELIQLMESVYLDLDLDATWDDPDNRGWINLFKHWSWSGMLRSTWAISAATYGHRFQTFCADRLGLGLGEVAVKLLIVSEPDGALPALDGAMLEAALERAGKAFLNFHEREQVLTYVGWLDLVGVDTGQRPVRWPKIHQVVQLEVVVPGAKGVDRSQDELLRFGFGYALLGAEGDLALFRVQDHLRRMGLASRALRLLLASDVGTGRPARRRARRFDRALASMVKTPWRTGDEREAAERFVEEFRGGGRRLARMLRAAERELRESG